MLPLIHFRIAPQAHLYTLYIMKKPINQQQKQTVYLFISISSRYVTKEVYHCCEGYKSYDDSTSCNHGKSLNKMIQILPYRVYQFDNRTVFISKHFLCKMVFFRKLIRRNGTPPLFDALPFGINNENDFLLKGVMCIIFDNSPRSSVG